MKVRSSIKSARLRGKTTSYVVRRGKRIYVCDKQKPRFKVRQG